MNTSPMSHIVFHNLQRLEPRIKHKGKHIIHMLWIIGLQKLQKWFDDLNNLCPHVVLKDDKLNIKCIQNIKNINKMSNLSL